MDFSTFTVGNQSFCHIFQHGNYHSHSFVFSEGTPPPKDTFPLYNSSLSLQLLFHHDFFFLSNVFFLSILQLCVLCGCLLQASATSGCLNRQIELLIQYRHLLWDITSKLHSISMPIILHSEINIPYRIPVLQWPLKNQE